MTSRVALGALVVSLMVGAAVLDNAPHMPPAVSTVLSDLKKIRNRAARTLKMLRSGPSSGSYPEWKSSGPEYWKIPLQHGLTIVTAIGQRRGDYESIKRIEATTGRAIQIAYSSDIPEGNSRSQASKERPTSDFRRVSCIRTVLRQDLLNATEYRENFCQDTEESYPGTTAIGISAKMLSDLKTKGESPFKYHAPHNETCLLKRVELADVAFPVLVNGGLVDLPAVHARCTSNEDAEDAEFYFLDNPDNALSLAWQIGLSNRLQVIKVSTSGGTPQIEESLKQTGRADVYGIYFDFGSASIRPESEPVLKEIAEALAKNPTWKLKVEGHTDNVGRDAFNLDLSSRRAEAVRQTLVERYHSQANRLATVGFGASRPKATNDTLEGRARNRRVELVR